MVEEVAMVRGATGATELQIALSFCSPCLTVTTLRLYGKLIVQYMNLSKIGCSNAFRNSPLDIWLKAPTRRATR
jgi:hypothetical protein